LIQGSHPSPDRNGYPTASDGKCFGARSMSGERDKANKEKCNMMEVLQMKTVSYKRKAPEIL
jgi:hypothetical protein